MIRSLIVAASENDVIGQNGDLPWHIPGDLQYFREVTQGHAVVLGRLTHESIVARLGRPLPRRTNVVVSTSARPASGDVHWQPSVTSALATAEALERAVGNDEVFVIGGASVYRQALATVDRIYLTRVHGHVEGDSRMPSGWLEGFASTSCVDAAASGATPPYSFLRFERVSA
ncbi:dihydrofolate reductase [Streptomyces sp. LUP47B]|uniref:dihydrofolate reductase n=1 Tax=Streptomyces sp. LUP47B TaxID=1890286 RepID=UPI000851F7A8|nr:dihydrofolate reductase [Streptomyces sp. LUP47B]